MNLSKINTKWICNSSIQHIQIPLILSITVLALLVLACTVFIHVLIQHVLLKYKINDLIFISILTVYEMWPTLRLSGSSCLPAYPGFMVMKMVHVGFSISSVPSKKNRVTPWLIAIWMHWICCAITDRTSSSIRLNSSKHDHAPDCARPLKNLPIAL